MTPPVLSAIFASASVGALTTVAAAKFVGFSFFLSLFLLWGLIQGLVFLAERYSDLVSGVQLWRSMVLSFVALFVMTLAWSLPSGFRPDVPDNLLLAMTSSILFGGVTAWLLTGRLYQFDAVHRAIVAVGVPLFVFCAIALAETVFRSFGG